MTYLYTKRGNAQWGINGLKFETFLTGRTWHGTAKIEDDNLAQIALDRFPQIEEVTKKEYDDIKKNETLGSSSFRIVPLDPTRPVHAQVVDDVTPDVEPVDASSLLMVGSADG
jgi:hypothetical protein